jgi:hypothetical protein
MMTVTENLETSLPVWRVAFCSPSHLLNTFPRVARNVEPPWRRYRVKAATATGMPVGDRQTEGATAD